MRGAADGLRKEHDEPRHQQKHREQGADDALGQHQTQVIAQAKLHQHQRNEARDGGEARGRNFNDGFRQRLHQRLLVGGEVLHLILVAVGENDGIVNSEGELHDDSDGVGDGGDSPQPEICAHIEKGRKHKDDEENHHFKIAAGGEEQDRRNDRRGNEQQAAHLLRKLREVVFYDHAVAVGIIGREDLADLIFCCNDQRIRGGAGIAHGEQGRSPRIVGGRVVKAHTRDTVQRLDFGCKRLGPFIGDVRDHDIRRVIVNELLVHDVHAPARLRLRAEKHGEIRADLHLADGQSTVDRRSQKQQHDDKAPADHRRGDQVHHILLFCAGLLHGGMLSFSRSRWMRLRCSLTAHRIIVWLTSIG